MKPSEKMKLKELAEKWESEPRSIGDYSHIAMAELLTLIESFEVEEEPYPIKPTILCPKCPEGLAHWRSDFRKYQCEKCNWFGLPKPPKGGK